MLTDILTRLRLLRLQRHHQLLMMLHCRHRPLRLLQLHCRHGDHHRLLRLLLRHYRRRQQQRLLHCRHYHHCYDDAFYARTRTADLTLKS
jgi:hypothetical protein